MAIQDVMKWLQTLQDNYPHIQTVLVHIGVNDCVAGHVSTESWVELIDQLKRSFHFAKICLSSIIPARGRHNLNNSIFPSNRNLHAACSDCDITVIDNHDTFITRNGAPRLALYKDALHPSAKGTVKLAENLVMCLPMSQRSEQHQIIHRSDIHMRAQEPPEPFSEAFMASHSARPGPRPRVSPVCHQSPLSSTSPR